MGNIQLSESESWQANYKAFQQRLADDAATELAAMGLKYGNKDSVQLLSFSSKMEEGKLEYLDDVGGPLYAYSDLDKLLSFSSHKKEGDRQKYMEVSKKQYAESEVPSFSSRYAHKQGVI